jgi:ABC-type polysaccharide/polyol phosphate transport system ATPase subunit
MALQPVAFGAEYLGAAQIVTIEIEQGRIKARLPAFLAVRLGEAVGLTNLTDCWCLLDNRTRDSGARITRASAMAEILVRHVTKRFIDIEAVRDLTLDVANSEFVVPLRATGAGKTTTLRLIAGLEYPDDGAISIRRPGRVQRAARVTR